jgi:predicted Fe-Mo cluster-binding NifX family protein
MKIAIPVWDNHVSTVLDFSNRLIIVDYDSGRIGERSSAGFGETSIIQKVARLRELGVNVLLCGAVSGPLERMILASGIVVIPFLRGTVDEVLDAYLGNRLVDERFALPGCYPAGMGYGRRGMGRRGRRGGWGKRRREWL